MRNSKLMAFILVGLFIMTFLILSGRGEAASTQVIELKYGTPFPPSNVYSVTFMEWKTKVEKETNGRVHITPYWGGTLTGEKEAIAELVRGAADIAYIAPSQTVSLFPIEMAQRLVYYGVPDFADHRKIYMELKAKFPEIGAEFEKVKVLCANTGGMGSSLQSRKPMQTLADLRGKQIRVSGTMIPVFKSFGVECITLPVSDIYMAFEKSMIDGALINDEVLGSMKIAEVVQYNTHIAYPTGVNTSTAMNLNSWNKLPPDIQKVFENNTEFWGLEMLKQMEKLDVIGRDFAKQKGVKFLEMPEADLKKIWAATEVEAKKAAAALDAQGKPGTAILNEARRIAKNYGAK